MNCKNALRLVDAYVDEELSLRDAAEMDLHLAECSTCHQEVQEARAMKVLLGDVPPVGPSEGFEERLVRNVLHNPEPVSAPLRPRFGFAWAACAGVAAAAVTFAFLSNRPTTDLAQTTPDQVLKNDIGHDLVYTSGTDPLGPRVVLPSSYVRR